MERNRKESDKDNIFGGKCGKNDYFRARLFPSLRFIKVSSLGVRKELKAKQREYCKCHRISARAEESSVPKNI